MQGKLFTQDFLREGIQETDAWNRLDSAELARFRARIETIFGVFPADSQANEAVTETEIIFPVLEALGWAYLPQQTASGKGRQDVPDVLAVRGRRRQASGAGGAQGRATLSSRRRHRGMQTLAASAGSRRPHRSPRRERAIESDVALSEPGGGGLRTGDSVGPADQWPVLAAVFSGRALAFRGIFGTRLGAARRHERAASGSARSRRSGRRPFSHRVLPAVWPRRFCSPARRSRKTAPFSPSPWRKPGAGKRAFPRIWGRWCSSGCFRAWSRRWPNTIRRPPRHIQRTTWTPCAARR